MFQTTFLGKLTHSTENISPVFSIFFKGHDNGQDQNYCTVCILCQQHSATLDRLSTPYSLVKKLCNRTEQKLMMFFWKTWKISKGSLSIPHCKRKANKAFQLIHKKPECDQKGTFPFVIFVNISCLPSEWYCWQLTIPCFRSLGGVLFTSFSPSCSSCWFTPTQTHLLNYIHTLT